MPFEPGTGTIRQINVPDPGAGLAVNIPVPTHRRWRILGLQGQFTEAGAVANSTIFGTYGNGSADTGAYDTNQLVPALSTATFFLTPGYPLATTRIATAIFAALPDPLYIIAGGRLSINASNFAAADSFHDIFMDVEEWVDSTI